MFGGLMVAEAVVTILDGVSEIAGWPIVKSRGLISKDQGPPAVLFHTEDGSYTRPINRRLAGMITSEDLRLLVRVVGADASEEAIYDQAVAVLEKLDMTKVDMQDRDGRGVSIYIEADSEYQNPGTPPGVPVYAMLGNWYRVEVRKG